MSTTKPTEARQHNIVVMTGKDLRHQYFIKKLNYKFRIAAVFIDTPVYPSPPHATEEEHLAWNWFFDRRQLFEKTTITPKLSIKSKNVPNYYYLKKGEINSPKTRAILKQYMPGFIAVFGVGIIDEITLSLYPNSIFNLHVGLPKFYRGSSCNFWPIHNCDLTNLGATIHQVEKGIDTGKISAENHIHLKPNDNEQSLLWKTLEIGTKLMEETIKNWQTGKLCLRKQKQKGQLYRMSDFKPSAILRVKKMVESGELRIQIESIQK